MSRHRKYQDLIVWQRAMDLVADIYKATLRLPDSEKFGLIAQLQRAAVSVPSNIAEGAGRGSTKEFLYFLSVARGSLFEVETQLLIGERLGLLERTDDIIETIEAIFAMIAQLTKRLQAQN